MPKILVIDDDDALRRTLEAALVFFGYEAIVARDGEEGIRLAREKRPDLVLCDVNMPGMDGRQVLQTLRSDPQLGNRQIVLMTGNQEQNPQREGMNLGADDYLAKPFEIAQLRKCVDARLRRSQMYRRLEDGMLRRHAELFGSTLPHEFMTPLNGIMGFAEILKEDLGEIPRDESLQMLTDIESCAKRLHRTLMNYILLVTIENATEQAPPTILERDKTMNLITEVANAVARKADRLTDLTLEIQPVSVQCYEDDLRTIVEHLIENAFGFSVPGSRVTVALKASSGIPTLRVEDAGRGMTPEQIEQIGMFMQFERKRFEQQGLGIGLALVKRVTERNRAEVRFDSIPGKGTVASVKLKPGR